MTPGSQRRDGQPEVLRGLRFRERVRRYESFVGVSTVPRGPHMQSPGAPRRAQTNDSLLGITRRGAPAMWAGAVLVVGAGADMMAAPDHVDAWCTQRGRRSQRPPLSHPKPRLFATEGREPNRRCRSADAGPGTNVAERRRSCRHISVQHRCAKRDECHGSLCWCAPD